MNRATTTLFALLLFVLSGLFSGPLSLQAAEPVQPGQETAEIQITGAQDGSLSSRQQTILAQIVDYKAKLEELRKGMRGLSGEQQLAMGMQVRDAETQLRKILGDLLGLIQEQRDNGAVDSEALEEAKALIEEESEIIHREIVYIQDYLQNLRQDQAELEPLELLTRKQEISKNSRTYDGLLSDLLENANRMNLLSISATEDLAYLDELLKNRTLSISGEIKLMLDKISDLEKRGAKASDDDKGKIQTRIEAIKEEKTGATKSLAHLLTLMHARDMETTEYSELLIKATGQISREILDVDVAYSIFQHWLDFVQDWLRENGIGVAVKAIFVLFILLAFKLLAGVTKRLVRRTIGGKHSSLSRLMADFFVSMSGKLVMFIGLLVALSQLGIKIAPMLAGLGIAGFIIGFALQDVLSNFASGVMILIYQPFDVGDTIEVPEVSGKVQHMNLVSTIILTYDNQRLVVPNNKIWGNIIRNIHAEHIRRVDLSFGIGYQDDIAHAERVLRELVEEHELVLKEPEPNIKLHTLGDSSVNFIVRPWTATINYWEVYWDLTRSVKERFDAEGITIPFPQRDVHLQYPPPPQPPQSGS